MVRIAIIGKAPQALTSALAALPGIEVTSHGEADVLVNWGGRVYTTKRTLNRVQPRSRLDVVRVLRPAGVPVAKATGSPLWLVWCWRGEALEVRRKDGERLVACRRPPVAVVAIATTAVVALGMTFAGVTATITPSGARIVDVSTALPISRGCLRKLARRIAATAKDAVRG